MREGEDRAERAALREAAARRPLGGGETPDLVEAAAERIADLLATLESPDRERFRDEALEKLATEDASLRKLEKKIRQASLATVSESRVEEALALAPEIEIEDLRGTVRFTLREDKQIEIAGDRYRIPVVARLVGGELERALLTQSAAEFVAQAREALARELERARTEGDVAAAKIAELVSSRAARPLYDQRSLRRVVLRAMREAEDLAQAQERIEYELKKLDRDADERERVRALIEEHELFAYREYFPRAREMQRELVLFAGPTNSGKTWRALNELVQGESGVYLAPLRLLALEGQEEIEKRGKLASFLTGEERDLKEGASFVASTIEMLDTSRVVDVAVIDEVQLLTDEQRGWAWCQALVGVPARRVLMTGSPDCIPLVRAMADYLGEPLTIVELERHTPIEALDRKLSLEHIKPGTAVIAFSRREVLAIKAELEQRYKVSVIYGNLTPEVRREEARRFREGEAQVLVSTDAIAMGLNLPIRTVLFSTLVKWNGQEEVQLEPWQILQIGGRAGRFGFHECGFVGAMNKWDAGRVEEVFHESFEPPHRELRTTVRPGPDHVKVIAEALHTNRLARALGAFVRGMHFDSELLTPGVQEEMIMLAELADHYERLTLEERLVLSTAPVDTRSEWLVREYDTWMEARAQGRQVTLRPLHAGFVEKDHAADDDELQGAESEAKRLMLYSWLAFRFPETFPDLDVSVEQRVALDGFIERSLASKGRGERERRRRGRRPTGGTREPAGPGGRGRRGRGRRPQ